VRDVGVCAMRVRWQTACLRGVGCAPMSTQNLRAPHWYL
jgi:hypothetical protein